MNYLQCSLPSCQHELKIFFWFQNCAKIKWKIDLQTTGFKKITMMGLLMTNVLRRVLFYLWERVNLLLKVILGTSMLHSAPQALIYLSLSKLASEYESGIQHVKMDPLTCQEAYHRYYAYHQPDFTDPQAIVGRVHLERNGCLEKLIHNPKSQHHGCSNYMDNLNRCFLKHLKTCN